MSVAVGAVIATVKLRAERELKGEDVVREFVLRLARRDLDGAVSMVIPEGYYSLVPRPITGSMNASWNYAVFIMEFRENLRDMINRIQVKSPSYMPSSLEEILPVSVKVDSVLELTSPRTGRKAGKCYICREMLFSVGARYRIRLEEVVYFDVRGDRKIAGIPRMTLQGPLLR